MARSEDSLRSLVLVAGHHGSRTSTSAGFLNTVAPEYVLFSAGYRNRYGFPQPEVLARVESLGAVSLDTMGDGAIEFQFFRDGPPTAPRLHRHEQRRYWTHRP